jgi:hypothetical protein
VRRRRGKISIFGPLLTGLEFDRGGLAELKGFIKRNWNYYDVDLDQGLDVFLAWGIDKVDAKTENARGQFRDAGLEGEICET